MRVRGGASQHTVDWLEPSAFGSKTGDPDREFLIEMYSTVKDQGLIDKMIYGSDGPQSPGFVLDYLERSVESMNDSNYTTEEVQRVLYGTAQELFALGNQP